MGAAPGKPGEVVIAGIGNAYRHDDAVGLVVGLGANCFEGVRDIGPILDPLELLGRWDGAGLAIVIDAIRSGESPGSIRVVELTDEDLSSAPEPARALGGTDGDGVQARATSSHGIDLAEVLHLARLMRTAPRRVVLVGIEGTDFSQGVGLSESVGAAVPEAVREINRILEAFYSCA